MSTLQVITDPALMMELGSVPKPEGPGLCTSIIQMADSMDLWTNIHLDQPSSKTFVLKKRHQIIQFENVYFIPSF